MKKNHVLIVGGSKGIGFVIAKTLAKEGYRVSVVARNPSLKTDAVDKNINFWTLDLLDGKAIPLVLNKIVDERGKLTSIVFCQRYRGNGDDWEGEIKVSLTATKEIIDHSINHFDTLGDNSIVIISSIASSFIVEEQPLSYHVGKAGINQLIKYYAIVLGPKKIRVNGISPGTVLKEENKEFYLGNKKLQDIFKKIIPIGRMIMSEDVANLTSFLCSPKASGITGQNMLLDGGLSLKGHESMARVLTNLDDFKKTKTGRTKSNK
ncbi:MAG: SDR family oxidoreductase [Nanoarchaeota archaeon]|nr:SDR family oxidoreductase [Nanoarchaeota archaeon]MBU1597776.1 SDR family oxidoreductase [Nanoarchaeota archaeon]MBU2441227.1 SDR family oxidoreductase [Nanoarchaeota archaeon]